MSKLLKRFEALVNQAVHKDTPIELARTTAMVALREFEKLRKENPNGIVFNDEYMIIRKDSVEYIGPEPNPIYNDIIETIYDNIVPPMPTDKEENEVSLFQVKISSQKGKCISCGKEYNNGEIIAWSRGRGETHHRCRSYFMR